MTQSSPKTPEGEAQLVFELYVKNIKEVTDFYISLGFAINRDSGDFVVLEWDGTYLFLAEETVSEMNQNLVGNIRIMVDDVDAHWARIQDLGVEVLKPIGDRTYNLRDFTIKGPGGVGIRFGQRVK